MLKKVDYPRILMTRFQQLSALYQEIIESPKFTGRLQDDYLDCLVDSWRAIKRMYEVKGEWIACYTPKKKKVFKCSNCLAVSIQGQTNFCNNCGMRMLRGALNDDSRSNK